MSKSKSANPSTKELVTKYLSLATDNAPKEVQPYMKKAAPHIIQFAEFLESLIPFFNQLHAKALELWTKVEPYRPELLIPSFVGFVMCFFGGAFLTLIAAVEAWNMCGYESTMGCIMMLVEDFKIIMEENKKDDKKDLDGDGTADVLQVSNSEMITRKTLLFLRILDPNRITAALGGITAGMMAVIAALKVKVSC